MNLDHNTNYTIHQKVLLLLPWHLNDTILGDEKKMVEAHLRNCLVCRAELEELKKISKAVSSADHFASSANAAFSELKKRINCSDQESAIENKKIRVPSSHGHNTTPLEKGRFIFRHAYLAQAAMVLLGFSWLILSFFGSTENQENQFRTLSSTKNIALNQNEIRVVFSTPIDESRINQIIAPFHGEMISGPSPQGVYIFRISGERIDRKDIQEIISKLRTDRKIIFVEPALSAVLPQNSG